MEDSVWSKTLRSRGEPLAEKTVLGSENLLIHSGSFLRLLYNKSMAILKSFRVNMLMTINFGTHWLLSDNDLACCFRAFDGLIGEC